AISRFWAQRVNWSADKNKYVMLGVTGPNEYENNVNNNWYTNRIASWCMEYTGKVIKDLEQNAPERLREILEKVSLENKEQVTWNHIVEQFYYPEDASKGVFLQQDGFLDKEDRKSTRLNSSHVKISYAVFCLKKKNIAKTYTVLIRTR